MNKLKMSKLSQRLDNYIFIRDITKIEGDVDMFGGELPPITLTIPNYDSNRILCLLKDNLVKDEVWKYLNQEERVKQELIQRGMVLPHYKIKYFFRYKMPDTGKIITIECREYFLIDYYNKKDIKELKKVAFELKEVK